MTNIELKHVTNYILKNVNLEILSGELMVILGPNGAGKTTLLNVIAGLTKYNGTVLFNGKPIDKVPPHLRNIGYVPQNLALFPHLKVYDNVAYGLKVRSAPKSEVEKRVREVMELLDIWHLRNKYPMKLSGGEQQKVAIARALAIKPKILLLDEPFNNLQTNTRKSLRLEVKKIQKLLKVTTVFVTHDILEAEELGDRIAVLNKGKILGVGTFTEVLPIISSTICKLNVFKGKIVRLVNSELAEVMCGDIKFIAPLDSNLYEYSGTVTITIPPDKILLYKTKPRVKVNTFKGFIKSIGSKAVNEVVVDIGGVELSVLVNYDALSYLNFKVGDEIYVKIPIRHIRINTLE